MSVRVRYGPNERHDPQTRRLGVDELMRSSIRAAGGKNAGDIIAAENLQHLIERIKRVWFLIVMQMRVEYFEPRLRLRDRATE